jgi:hypothetical protein
VARGVYEGKALWLRWCDKDGNLIPTGAERAQAEAEARQEAEARAQAEAQSRQYGLIGSGGLLWNVRRIKQANIC